MVLALPYLYKIVLNGVDVTSYIHSIIELKRPNGQLVKTGRVKIKKSVDTVLSISNLIIGDSVTIQRGFTVSTERYILQGEVVSYKDMGSVYEFVVSDKMYRCTRREKDYTYDINIDTQAGVGSEIVKDLFDTVSISYDSNSVQSTGTDTVLKINLYPAKGSITSTIKDLSKMYRFQAFYNSDEDLGYFIPEGYTSTSTILTTGVEIPNRIQWNISGEDIINNLTVIGGTQADTNIETFSGDDATTDYVLAAKIIDTYITVDGTLQNRGVNSSDPNDFYVKSDAKTIVFTTAPPSTAADNVVIQYTYNVPVKVNHSDDTSITNYNQHDTTVINDRFTNSDDAEISANAIIDEKAESITSAPVRVLGNNDIETGQIIKIVDTVSDITRNVVVKSVTYSYPYKGDFLEVGKIPTDAMDIQLSQLENVARLQRQLATDSDINVQLINTPVNLAVVGYHLQESAGMDTGALYWESDTQGTWNDYDWGDTSTETYTVDALIPVNYVIFEDFYSTEFKGGSTTATWSTSGSVAFTSGQIAESEFYLKDTGTTVSSAILTASYSGTLTLEISADGSNWETVTSGVRHTFTNTGNFLYWRATEAAATTATLNSIKVIING